jgi:hypothetical protein
MIFSIACPAAGEAGFLLMNPSASAALTMAVSLRNTVTAS